MPHITHNFVLDVPLSQGAVLEMPYPKDKTEGSFFGAFNHTISIAGRFFRSPQDFVVVPKPGKMLLKWLHTQAIPVGCLVNMQLEEIGLDSYLDPKTGVSLKNTVAAPTFLLSFRSPIAATDDYYMPRTLIKSAGSLPLQVQFPDIPRSVSIHSTGDDSNRTFRIEGEDYYYRTMIEEVRGANAGIAESNKAFAKISRVITDDACAGEVSVGCGLRLGFPVFIASTALVLKVIYGNQELSGCQIISGDIDFAGTSSSDRRGLLIPPAGLSLDGKTSLYALAALTNPSNIGSPDYSG